MTANAHVSCMFSYPHAYPKVSVGCLWRRGKKLVCEWDLGYIHFNEIPNRPADRPIRRALIRTLFTIHYSHLCTTLAGMMSTCYTSTPSYAPGLFKLFWGGNLHRLQWEADSTSKNELSARAKSPVQNPESSPILTVGTPIPVGQNFLEFENPCWSNAVSTQLTKSHSEAEGRASPPPATITPSFPTIFLFF